MVAQLLPMDPLLMPQGHSAQSTGQGRDPVVCAPTHRCQRLSSSGQLSCKPLPAAERSGPGPGSAIFSSSLLLLL